MQTAHLFGGGPFRVRGAAGRCVGFPYLCRECAVDLVTLLVIVVLVLLAVWLIRHF